LVFLEVFLKNGVGGSKKCGFIGLICFWAKNGGKNERFFYKNERVLSKNCKKLTVFEHFFCTS